MGLLAEASCPVCRELFRDPVSIHCGHHFCRGCITRRWEWATGPFRCPRCHQTAPERTLRPSPELARLLEITKGLDLEAVEPGVTAEEEEPGEGEWCGKHGEPVGFFCRDDGVGVCAVCRESRAHRSHAVLPATEAVREYQGRVQARLQGLTDARDRLLALRDAEMRRNCECLEKTEAERRRVASAFEGLRVLLEDAARLLLARLGALERDMERAQEDAATALTTEISRVDAAIRELQDTRGQPAGAFLRDIEGTLSRCDEGHFQPPTSLLAELEDKIGRFGEKNAALEETLRSFQDVLMFELPEKIPVTLDPSTAHPQLAVSPDGRSVRWEDPRATRPARALDTDPCVLGRPGVTSGTSCWEVEVPPQGSWALGVAKGAMRRSDESPVPPSIDLWSMGLCHGQFWALTSLERVPLHQLDVPRRVRVSLDYDKGHVAFFDADKRSLIFTFPAASFGGERVQPWFLVWGEGSQITLRP
ncbi:E3 ubiquitin-protein ligase TRIM7-like [Patagioenas fasciata]|uniref:E3 ubiquitin-protein ligase TRIM7-like n=1 Tax=Patagioenas fasciata TaxID=372321 RepID=UPI0032E87595